jgi:hypothetical protein
MNPTLIQMMAEAKNVEIGEATAARSSHARSEARGGLVEGPVGTSAVRSRTIAPRRTVGLFLVRVGNRLASPQPRTVCAR